MDFKPTLNDVLYTSRQWAVREELHKLFGELEEEYRKSDQEFSLASLRAYDLIQGANGVTLLRISTELEPELQGKLQAIGKRVLERN